jgi:GNAT superfamily N-acetyltransferase
MEVQHIKSDAKKITLQENGQEIARVFIYLIYNGLHSKPYALLEDLFVQEQFRGKGVGMKILQTAITEAKKADCYKIIGTSRHTREKVHKFYNNLGFEDYGKEFRMNLEI